MVDAQKYYNYSEGQYKYKIGPRTRNNKLFVC